MEYGDILVLSFFDVVRLSLARYRMNPVIIVPPLVGMVVPLVTSLLLKPPVPSQPYTSELFRFVFLAFGVLLLNLIVSFLVVVGQASMAGKVVVEGKTRLADWSKGVKKYALRVLGIGLIYLGILVAFFMLLVMIFVFAMLPQLMSQIGKVTPPSTPLISPSVTKAMGAVTALLMTIASSVFYMWLAPAIIDNKGVFASLDAGTKAIRKCGKAFLGFLALFFAVSVTVQLIGAPVMLGAQPVWSVVTPMHMVSGVIAIIFSPLWFLIAFTIYQSQSVAHVKVEGIDSDDCRKSLA